MPAPEKKTQTTTTPARLLAGKVMLRPDEAAVILAVGKSLVYDMAACGELKSCRIRGAVRIYAESVRELLEKEDPEKINRP
jgi:excisionase family DNA binding protein